MKALPRETADYNCVMNILIDQPGGLEACRGALKKLAQRELSDIKRQGKKFSEDWNLVFHCLSLNTWDPGYGDFVGHPEDSAELLVYWLTKKHAKIDPRGARLKARKEVADTLRSACAS